MPMILSELDVVDKLWARSYEKLYAIVPHKNKQNAAIINHKMW